MATSGICNGFTEGKLCGGRRSFNRKGVELAQNCSNKNIVALGSLFYVELYRRSLGFGHRKPAGTTISASAASRPARSLEGVSESQNCTALKWFLHYRSVHSFDVYSKWPYIKMLQVVDLSKVCNLWDKRV
jgi:hypothetical protein